MALATAATIADATGINVDFISDSRIEAASREMKRRIDLAVYEGSYEEIEARAASDEAQKILIDGESLLAFHYALPFMNLYVTESGGIVRSSGPQEDRRDLMSQNELSAYRDEIAAQVDQSIKEVLEYEQENNDKLFDPDVVEYEPEPPLYTI